MIMPAWGTPTPLVARLCRKSPGNKPADPNCYILVSQGVEQLGDRLEADAEAEWHTACPDEDDNEPPWAKWEGKEW